MIFITKQLGNATVKTNGSVNLVIPQHVNILVITVTVLQQRLVFVSASLDGKVRIVINQFVRVANTVLVQNQMSVNVDLAGLVSLVTNQFVISHVIMAHAHIQYL